MRDSKNYQKNNIHSQPSLLELWTKEFQFGLRIPRNLIEEMVAQSRAAKTKETGGILIGNYSKARDVAVVREIRAAPEDSARGNTWFQRGIAGLNALLIRRWKLGRYYLGEWHFHPGGAPIPSKDDRKQMRDIAANPSYKCREPLLIIIGGIPDRDMGIGAFVYPKEEELEFFPPSQ